MKLRVLAFALIGFLGVPALHASVVGMSKVADGLTPARIDALPARQRAAWQAYLERSEKQMAADHASLAAERKGMTEIPPVPRTSGGMRSMPMNRDAAFYGSPEARHVADVIVSFQTPAGGWGKNMDFSGAPRAKGQIWVSDNNSKFLGPDDFDAAKDPSWHYVGTMDNDATTTQMRFLARVQAEAPGAEGDAYRASFLRGVEYLLHAQYPNGGWPQGWPLEGGYHDAITYNDNVETEAAEVLTAAANGTGDYSFVPQKVRTEARRAAAHALDCILASQIVVNGKKTIWAQQHDMLTLAPVAARNFEPVALATGESAHMLAYLMSLPNPSPAVKAAVTDGVEWLKAHAVYGEAMVGGRGDPAGRRVVPQAGAGPIWARYYSVTTEKPIFGDRDKTIHDSMNDLSLERRNGYAWYGTEPKVAIEDFVKWDGGKTPIAGVS
jgi:PelA/Pel-15E family pectate lyase